MPHPMDQAPRATFTVLLHPPIATPGRTRRWSAHCLELNLGVSAGTAPAVRMRLASSVAAQIALGPLGPRREVDPALWHVARDAALVTVQTVETEAGPVAIRYLRPSFDAVALP